VSIIKDTALTVLNIIDELAQPRLKNVAIRKFWNWFFIAHGKNAIMVTDDSILKESLRKGYLKLKPIFENTDIAYTLKEVKLNPELNQKLMKLPDFTKMMDLIDDVL